jgi:hypothetical protein
MLSYGIITAQIAARYLSQGVTDKLNQINNLGHRLAASLIHKAAEPPE